MTVDLEPAVALRLASVRERLAAAARRAGRDPASIRLVAVSKGFGPEHIRAAAAAGQRDFGENRVQEALQKIGAAADLGITWHLVGHLQSNKVRKAVGPFRWIHSVDRAELLVRLEQAAAAAGAPLRVLVQVDLAGEPTKFGAPPAEARRIVEAAAGCRAVELAGLMVLPPFAEDPEVVRPYFARLRELRDEFVREGAAPAGALAELSMGMSHDFEVAIEEGATMVRVGTAIFGPRPETAGGVRA